MRPALQLLFAATLVSTAACSDDVRPVGPGNYKGRSVEATLTVDRGRNVMTLRVGPAPVERSFRARDRAGWLKDCRKNTSAEVLEVLEVDGGPLAVGTAALARPIIVASCGSSGALDLSSLGEDGAWDKANRVTFEPLK